MQRTAVDTPASYLDVLYGATPGTVIDEVNKVSDEVSTLLVVGHEPTMSHLALGLAGPGSDRDAAEQIGRKYPTSAIAVLQVLGPWADLGLSGAELRSFHVPR